MGLLTACLREEARISETCKLVSFWTAPSVKPDSATSVSRLA